VSALDKVIIMGLTRAIHIILQLPLVQLLDLPYAIHGVWVKVVVRLITDKAEKLKVHEPFDPWHGRASSNPGMSAFNLFMNLAPQKQQSIFSNNNSGSITSDITI